MCEPHYTTQSGWWYCWTVSLTRHAKGTLGCPSFPLPSCLSIKVWLKKIQFKQRCLVYPCLHEAEYLTIAIWTPEKILTPDFFVILQALDDARFELIMSKINLIIHEDTKYQKGTLPMRIQKCFAVKVSIWHDVTRVSCDHVSKIKTILHFCFLLRRVTLTYSQALEWNGHLSMQKWWWLNEHSLHCRTVFSDVVKWRV